MAKNNTAKVNVVHPLNIASKFFKVDGAGLIQISTSTGVVTGNVKGFHFGVEWGQHGYAGGVLDKQEAIRLADFIYEQLGCNKIKIIEIKDEKNI